MNKHTTLLFILLLVSLTTNAQCAMCKAVVENGDKDLAEGVNSGIKYLVVFPYLFLAIGIFIYYINKKRESKKL